jgi:hypothetical protein
LLRIEFLFPGEKVVERFALRHTPSPERDRPPDHAIVGYSNDVLVTDRRRRQSFLSKTGNELRIVSYEVGRMILIASWVFRYE